MEMDVLTLYRGMATGMFVLFFSPIAYPVDEK